MVTINGSASIAIIVERRTVIITEIASIETGKETENEEESIKEGIFSMNIFDLMMFILHSPFEIEKN